MNSHQTTHLHQGPARDQQHGEAVVVGGSRTLVKGKGGKSAKKENNDFMFLFFIFKGKAVRNKNYEWFRANNKRKRHGDAWSDWQRNEACEWESEERDLFYVDAPTSRGWIPDGAL